MTNQLTIRQAIPTDLQKVLAIENQSFKEQAFNARQFKYLMGSPTCTFVVADYDSQVVGYLILLRRKKSRTLRIYSIAVGAAHRGKGIGLKLLEHAQTEAQRHGDSGIRLEVDEANQVAVAFYTRFGFQIKGLKPDYYGPGQHALVMRS